MMNRKWQKLIAGCAVLVALLFVVAEVEARRGGGGRGGGGRSFSRSGPASGGSVSSHQVQRGQRGDNRSSLSDNRGSRQENRGDRRGDLQDSRGDRQDDIQDARKERREDWQDYGDDVRDDRRDWYDDRYRYHRRVGVSISFATFNTLSCTTVYVDGATFYHCDSDWYTRAYHGGNVTYIVVNAPAGY